eukprot:CAMPEP_0184645810 /NCGR_PEP_ID=MMETSP0308-20130426/2397_1 /TAXON_ID=38269 /ORGANISM="Gloeochaete witrockiana, Strain SAG 46.84" /LENGTH=411 /DNA_ID=CAMNT_0027075231 /DNA_START=166 /DNA_END=1402 /DNA_ORIENTATION=+
MSQQKDPPFFGEPSKLLAEGIKCLEKKDIEGALRCFTKADLVALSYGKMDARQQFAGKDDHMTCQAKQREALERLEDLNSVSTAFKIIQDVQRELGLAIETPSEANAENVARLKKQAPWSYEFLMHNRFKDSETFTENTNRLVSLGLMSGDDEPGSAQGACCPVYPGDTHVPLGTLEPLKWLTRRKAILDQHARLRRLAQSKQAQLRHYSFDMGSDRKMADFRQVWQSLSLDRKRAALLMTSIITEDNSRLFLAYECDFDFRKMSAVEICPELEAHSLLEGSAEGLFGLYDREVDDDAYQKHDAFIFRFNGKDKQKLDLEDGEESALCHSLEMSACVRQYVVTAYLTALMEVVVFKGFKEGVCANCAKTKDGSENGISTACDAKCGNIVQSSVSVWIGQSGIRNNVVSTWP